MSKSNGQQVAEREKTPPLAVTGSIMEEMSQDAEQGFTGVGAEHLAIPFLAIIQSGSPQRKKADGKYIAGAEEGHIFNTVTNELFKTPDEPITVVPCAFNSQFLHWNPREEGGGLKGIYTATDDIVKQAVRDGARLRLQDGTYLVETYQHYVLHVYPDLMYKRVVIGMSSTQLRKSRRWLTIMSDKVVKLADGRMFRPPMFACKYQVSTQPEQNDQGSWYGWSIQEIGLLGDNERHIYEAGRKFSKAVLAGEVKTAAPPDEGGAKGDDEIPF